MGTDNLNRDKRIGRTKREKREKKREGKKIKLKTERNCTSNTERSQ